MSAKIVKDKEAWDNFVEQSPYGMLFHKWNFMKIMEKHSGYTFLPYGIYDDQDLLSICPLFYKKSLGLKLLFSPPPRTGAPYLGFVVSNTYDRLNQQQKECFLNLVTDSIDAEIKKIGPNLTMITTVPNFEDIRSFKWDKYDVNVKYTYVMDLNRPLEAIWSGFDDNCKKNVKICSRYPLAIREVNDTKTFFRFMVERYNQQGLRYPIIGHEYLKELLDAFPENLKMYFLYNQDKIVGIELVYQYKTRMMLWMGESRIQKNIPSNYYLRWEFIKKAKQEGYKEFEIEGANTRNLCLNKSRFNPCLERNFCVTRKDTLGKMVEWSYQNLYKKELSV